MIRRFLYRVDWMLLGVVVCITLLGVLMIGSAGGWRLDLQNPSIGPIMTKQLIGLCIGLIGAVMILLLTEGMLKFLSIPAYLAMLFLLLLVLIIGVGTNEGSEASDVRRWIPLFGGTNLQPSEYAKFLIIVSMARFLDIRSEKINKLPTVGIFLLLVAVPVFLVMREPDLSTSIIMLVICAAMIFAAGLDWKYIVAALILIALGVCLVIQDAYREGGPLILNEYQATRIWAFFDPQSYSQDLAYQTLRSTEAISAGGFRGLGLFHSSGLVPVPMTDFIFGITCEELGFFGAGIYLILLIAMVARIIWIATKAPTLYGKLLCVGAATWLAVQSLVHIGVTTGMLPNTGIPLPFMSYGVSSLVSNLAAVGLALHVYGDYRNLAIRYDTNEEDQFVPGLYR